MKIVVDTVPSELLSVAVSLYLILAVQLPEALIWRTLKRKIRQYTGVGEQLGGYVTDDSRAANAVANLIGAAIALWIGIVLKVDLSTVVGKALMLGSLALIARCGYRLADDWTRWSRINLIRGILIIANIVFAVVVIAQVEH